MKKLFTLLSLSITIAASAQSFSVYKTVNGNNTQTVTNGASINEVTSANNTTDTKIKIKNNATTTQTFSVIRTVVSSSPAFINDNSSSTPSTYFCFGFNCFGSAVNTPGSGDYTILLPAGQTSTTFPYADNSSQNNQPFTIYVDEGAVMGDYAVKYKIYNVANANDSLAFFMVYNNGQVGIRENGKSVSAVNLFPNPTAGNLNLSFEASTNDNLNIDIFNANGMLVKTISAPTITGVNTLQVSTTDFSDGLYEFVLKNGNSIERKKVIIAK